MIQLKCSSILVFWIKLLLESHEFKIGMFCIRGNVFIKIKPFTGKMVLENIP